MTVFNRREYTEKCLDSLFSTLSAFGGLEVDVWITDDGSTDGTWDFLNSYEGGTVNVLEGNGSLFWNGGMIKAWEAAVAHGGYDGYLWLNNDVEILPCLWKELVDADDYSKKNYGRTGIYVGSLTGMNSDKLTYGGFDFTSKISLKDEFKIPDGTYQNCQCAHGNITYVSSETVEKCGVFYPGYLHGGADHDYTYRAYKVGIPQFILRTYVGKCDNDHTGSSVKLASLPLKERLTFLKSPHGLNLHNTLLFQKRCFPWRLPFVWLTSYMKAVFPKTTYKIASLIR